MNVWKQNVSPTNCHSFIHSIHQKHFLHLINSYVSGFVFSLTSTVSNLSICLNKSTIATINSYKMEGNLSSCVSLQMKFSETQQQPQQQQQQQQQVETFLFKSRYVYCAHALYIVAQIVCFFSCYCILLRSHTHTQHCNAWWRTVMILLRRAPISSSTCSVVVYVVRLLSLLLLLLLLLLLSAEHSTRAKPCYKCGLCARTFIINIVIIFAFCAYFFCFFVFLHFLCIWNLLAFNFFTRWTYSCAVYFIARRSVVK